MCSPSSTLPKVSVYQHQRYACVPSQAECRLPRSPCMCFALGSVLNLSDAVCSSPRLYVYSQCMGPLMMLAISGRRGPCHYDRGCASIPADAQRSSTLMVAALACANPTAVIFDSLLSEDGLHKSCPPEHVCRCCSNRILWAPMALLHHSLEEETASLDPQQRLQTLLQLAP